MDNRQVAGDDIFYHSILSTMTDKGFDIFFCQKNLQKWSTCTLLIRTTHPYFSTGKNLNIPIPLIPPEVHKMECLRIISRYCIFNTTFHL